MKRSLFILVVEDNPDHQLLIGYSLRASIPQAEPVFKATASETLLYLESCWENQSLFPKLVLLEVNLPHPEIGWQLLKEIRTRYARLPVLVLSSYQGPDYVQQAYELGAHSFIEKPLNLSDWENHFQALGAYWLGVVTLADKY
ncbi:response regulator [Spirosoma flavum]|uniref:Response regulator n=1 Tax=Spirosoma flavum TaxID=2048557 RepID=A0ABW6AL78_9BACT